jgi:hypothetical protein
MPRRQRQGLWRNAALFLPQCRRDWFRPHSTGLSDPVFKVWGNLVKGDAVMMSLKKKAVVVLAAAGIVAGGFTVPAMAGGPTIGVDAKRLDKAQVDYTGYRYRYSRGARGAAIAGAVGLGILGAAIAANGRAYAAPSYYYEDYDAPPPAPVYAYPRRYYAPYGYYAPYDFRDYR